MSKSTRSILDIILFLVAFVAIQAVAEFVAAFIFAQIKGLSVNTVVQGMASGSFSSVLAISTVVSSLVTAVAFALLRWTPMSRHWIRTRPWGVLSWVVLLSLGIILPAEWLYERLEIAMPMQEVTHSVAAVDNPLICLRPSPGSFYFPDPHKNHVFEEHPHGK